MAPTQKGIERLKDFITRRIWEIDTSTLSSSKRITYAVIKRIVVCFQGYQRERLDYRAASLTYATLLALIPMLAILFAISRGFGFNKLIENSIRENFSTQPEAINSVIGFVNSYLTHTKSGIFIGFGLILLFWTLISLTANIEQAFNKIWQVKRPRPPFRKMTDYAAIFLLLPISIVVTSGLSIFVTTMLGGMSDIIILGHTARFFIKLTPYIFIGLMFTGLYAFMPNTHVKAKSALLAGFVAGTAFQLLQYFYINSQLWVSGYNAIYGSFAALPLLMLFCQIAWNICLFGAELSYVDQHIDNFYFGSNAPVLSRKDHDFLTLLIASFVCRRFADNQPAFTAAEIAVEKRIPIRLVNDILFELSESGIFSEIHHDEDNYAPAYQPNTALRNITVRTLFYKLDTKSDFSLSPELIKAYPDVEHTLNIVYEDGLASDTAKACLDTLNLQ